MLPHRPVGPVNHVEDEEGEGKDEQEGGVDPRDALAVLDAGELLAALRGVGRGMEGAIL